jgi:hypothetical protein
MATIYFKSAQELPTPPLDQASGWEAINGAIGWLEISRATQAPAAALAPVDLELPPAPDEINTPGLPDAPAAPTAVQP